MKNYQELKMNYNKHKKRLVQEDFLDDYFQGVKINVEYARHRKKSMKLNAK